MRLAGWMLLLFLTPIIPYARPASEHDTQTKTLTSLENASWSELEFSFFTDVDIADEILASLREGHRSEIHYEARIYKRTAGISQLMGDRLIAESSVLYEARWDELNERYIVLIDEEHEIGFEDPNRLTSFLLSLNKHRITLQDDPEGEIYLLCRAQIEPIRLVPPLTLMTFLLPKFRTTTPWGETEFTRIDR